MAIDPIIQKKANDIRTKVYGVEVREDLASGLETMSEDVEVIKGRQMTLEEQFQQVVDETTGKDIVSAPEIIAARGGEPSLNARLVKEDAIIKSRLNQIPPQTKTIKVFDKKPTPSQLLTGEVGLVKKPIDSSVLFTKKPTLNELTRTNAEGYDQLFYWTRTFPIGKTIDLNWKDYKFEFTFKLKSNANGVQFYIGLLSETDKKVVRLGLNTVDKKISVRGYQGNSDSLNGNLTHLAVQTNAIVSRAIPLASVPSNEWLTVRLQGKDNHDAKLSLIGESGVVYLETDYMSFYYTSKTYNRGFITTNTQASDGNPPIDYINYSDYDLEIKTHTYGEALTSVFVNNFKMEE